MDRRFFLKSSLAAAAMARFGFSKEPPMQPVDVISGNNQFALELFAKIRQEEGNLICSPFSVSTALAMTAAGARGKTAEQMQNVLHLPENRDAAHAAFARLIQQLNGPNKKDRGYALAVANALWGQKDYGFKKAFLEFLQQNYQASLIEQDFMGEPEKSRQTINHWVEKQTNDRIKDLLPQGSIMSSTRLVLTNAIYFKGNWADQFNKGATHDEQFSVGENQKIKTPMMHRTGDYGYFEDEIVQLLSIPFKGNELSMVFALPRKVGGLADLESKMTAQNLKAWFAGIRQSKVVVALPKFEMTKELMLAKTLSAMGMTAPFSDSADFSGMSDKEGLQISDVIHKAFVLVNEEGAEAAAATGVVIRATAMPVMKSFRADHPFLFFIRDNKSGSILFIGRLANPSK